MKGFDVTMGKKGSIKNNTSGIARLTGVFDLSPAKFLRAVIIDCISGFLCGISVQVFAVNANFAPGGLNGMAVIINYLTKLPIGALIVVLNIPIIIFAYRILGRGYLLRSIKSMLIGSFFMDYVAVYLPGYTGTPIMAALFAGVFAGIGYGILYMEGSCTAGSDFIIMSMKKLKPHMSVGELVQLIDGSVLIVAGLVYKDIDAILYGLIYTFVCSIVVDKIMYGAGSGKLAFIVTKKGEDICHAIHSSVHRGTTILPAYGGYQNEAKEVVMCVCRKKEAARIKHVAENEDESAFMIVTEFNEVFGEGFSPFDD